MARYSRLRKPTAAEVKHLQQVIDASPDQRQRRRAEILVLYAGGVMATAIAELLDEVAYPAHTLAVAYHERWEIEITIDEADTHQRRPQQQASAN